MTISLATFLDPADNLNAFDSQTIELDFQTANSPEADQLGVVVIGSRHPDPDHAIPETPTEWNFAGTVSGGAGAFAEDSGPRQTTIFFKRFTGDETTVQITLPSDADPDSFIIGFGLVLESDQPNPDWRRLRSLGVDETEDTDFSFTGDTPVHFDVGDYVVLGASVNDTSVSPMFTNWTVSADGIGFDTPTEHADFTATSNGLAVGAASAGVTSGSGIDEPDISVTLEAVATGSALLVRFRDVSPITAVSQALTTDPPRILLSTSGLDEDQIASITIYREIDGERVPVRASEDIEVTSDATTRTDSEQPFGEPIQYIFVFTDIVGVDFERQPTAVQVEAGNPIVVSDAINGLAVELDMDDWPSKDSTKDFASFNVNGRIITIQGPRPTTETDITLKTETNEERDNLLELLNNATQGIVQIRQNGTLDDAGLDDYIAVVSDREERIAKKASLPNRLWTIHGFESEPWDAALEALGFSLQDIADNYDTLEDIEADNATLFDIAIKDFGA